MKKTTKLLASVVAFSLMVGTTDAMSIVPNSELIEATNTDHWELVQNQHGIKAYLAKDEAGSYLKIKFENTSNEEISIKWLLSKGKEVKLKGEINNIIPATNVEAHDATNLIILNSGESVADFSLEINLKQ